MGRWRILRQPGRKKSRILQANGRKAEEGQAPSQIGSHPLCRLERAGSVPAGENIPGRSFATPKESHRGGLAVSRRRDAHSGRGSPYLCQAGGKSSVGIGTVERQQLGGFGFHHRVSYDRGSPLPESFQTGDGLCQRTTLYSEGGHLPVVEHPRCQGFAARRGGFRRGASA